MSSYIHVHSHSFPTFISHVHFSSEFTPQARQADLCLWLEKPGSWGRMTGRLRNVEEGLNSS